MLHTLGISEIYGWKFLEVIEFDVKIASSPLAISLYQC